ncbi:MAG: Mov34/MPN/PAD-1 family protein [Candidatus Electrothrix communis]|nr:MAG: Mov34/MPN/PAD-1 family protein [Candidatus Electrothrix communis]
MEFSDDCIKLLDTNWNRIKQLSKKDFIDVEEFFERYGNSQIIRVRYHIILKIHSPIGIDKKTLRPKNATTLKFEIKTPPDYPEKPLQCRALLVRPFHPHFDSNTYWLDYRTSLPTEFIDSFIIRLAYSLQYYSEYISIENNEHIGNVNALQWYLEVKDKKPSWFPIDKTPLPPLPYQNLEYHKSPSKTPQLTQLTPSNPPTSQGKKKFSLPRFHSSSRFKMIHSKAAPKQNKTFQIVNSAPAYQPSSQVTPFHKEGFPSSIRMDHGTHELYIQSEAKQKIFRHIGWDNSSYENSVEQGGILLGHVFRDQERSIIYGTVEDIVTGASARGTNAYLELDHTAWKQMIDDVDKLHAESGLQIIGWYHTHPNNLDVFMSDTDRATQSRIFSQPWQFAVVLNPHRGIWRVFHGADSLECFGIMLAAPPSTLSSSAPPEEVPMKDFSHPSSSGQDFQYFNKVIKQIHAIFSKKLTGWLSLIGLLGITMLAAWKIFPSPDKTLPNQKQQKLPKLSAIGVGDLQIKTFVTNQGLSNTEQTGQTSSQKGSVENGTAPSLSISTSITNAPATMQSKEQPILPEVPALPAVEQECFEIITLGEKSSKNNNSAFSFSEKKTVPSSGKTIEQSDIIFDFQGNTPQLLSPHLEHSNARESYFKIIDKKESQHIFLEKLDLPREPDKYTVIVKTYEEKYVTLELLEFGGKSPDRTIKFKYCYSSEPKEKSD